MDEGEFSIRTNIKIRTKQLSVHLTLDVVVEVSRDVLRHTGEVRLLSVHAGCRRRRSRGAASRAAGCRGAVTAVVAVRAGRVWIDSADAAAVSETPVPAHVGIVGEVLAADGAGELVAGARSGRGRSGRGRSGNVGGGGGGGPEAPRLGAVGFERGAAGVAACTCPPAVGVKVGAGVGAAQVNRQLGVGGEVTRAERAGAVRLRVLASHVLLEVAGLRETAGAQWTRQSTAAVDSLMTTSISQRRKTLVTLLTRVRLRT